MPPKRARSSPSVPEARERLTLAKLASYDDVATDALVDHAYFWTNIRKNRNKYTSARGIHDDEVGGILLHDVVVAKDIAGAERKLLELPGLRKYSANLPSPREKEWFRRHLRKYIQMYHPDSPFEVTTTNRYLITQAEAALCARKFIKAGQEIRYLSGTLVSMTKEEETDLGLTRKDFSVVMSSRRKTASFFLGPARFANHDCDANGRLVTRGTEGMAIMTTREIHEGEEITVSYGEDYFGIDNCECLCLTCERMVRNGWAHHADSDATSKESTPVSVDEAGPEENHSPRKKRRRDSDVDSEDLPSICSTPRKRAKFSRQTSKLREEISLSELPVDSTATPETDTPLTPGPEIDIHQIPSAIAVGRPVSGLRQEVVVSDVVESTPEAPSTDALLSSMEGPELSDLKNPDLAGAVKAALAPIHPSETTSTQPPALPGRESSSSVTGESHRSSTSSQPTSVDDLTKVEGPVLLETIKTEVELIPEINEPDHLTVRTPGDYTRTPKLLGQKYDRWVECQTCDSWFVQCNSYQTRRECPRCERHSKLYGYQWPQTDKGPDGEERVMDHRTIHRFLSNEEASTARKDQRRGLSFGITPTPELSDRTETENNDPPGSGSGSRRSMRASRHRTRELRMTM
ncbi:Histone-lysine N-methyltransferase set9 [Penicillium cosmopolitanum]|uniref:Histone-lysine N-methyltransferase SET9 n=1 Tax=Penicillium cosmopolitanum TaxID=1131564 RepID=A0A9W9VPZ3_9EURO|nr:Histone-lysine N-methyltransferase set9 [Penicillium cosmopolitanum]KAJ5387105.1 Histone-lysine N-methyltransferase set9 [Penicillium cosmopolitanum]